MFAFFCVEVVAVEVAVFGTWGQFARRSAIDEASVFRRCPEFAAARRAQATLDCVELDRRRAQHASEEWVGDAFVVAAVAPEGTLAVGGDGVEGVAFTEARSA